MFETALALAAMLASHLGEPPRPVPKPTGGRHAIVAPDPVLAEMAPAPGRWEVEDAPAYFSDRQAITDAPAPGGPVAAAPVAHRRP